MLLLLTLNSRFSCLSLLSDEITVVCQLAQFTRNQFIVEFRTWAFIEVIVLPVSFSLIPNSFSVPSGH
jgi:hypothetical protein